MVLNKTDITIIPLNVTCSRYDIAENLLILELNNNHSLTPTQVVLALSLFSILIYCILCVTRTTCILLYCIPYVTRTTCILLYCISCVTRTTCILVYCIPCVTRTTCILLYCIPRVTRTTCILFDLSYLGVVHSCRRIIQKRIVRTKLNIYVFMFTCDVLIFCLDTTCTTELCPIVVEDYPS